MLFGGLGFNVFNPALVGARVPAGGVSGGDHQLHAGAGARTAFAEFIPSTLAVPLMKAPPLADWIAQVARRRLYRRDAADAAEIRSCGDAILWTLFLGQRAGSTGETSALLILLCGVYLIAAQDDGLAHSRRRCC